MPSSPDRLRDLTEHAVRAQDPTAALRSMTVLREELEAFERRAAPVARVLEAGGVTLNDARRCAQPTLIDGRPPPPPPVPAAPGPPGVSAYARATFEQSLREAVKRGDGHIGVEHLLLASLEDPEGGAHRTLCELGLDPAHVRAELA